MAVRQIVGVLRRQTAQALRARDLDAAADLLDRLEEEEPLAVETRGLRLEFLMRSGRGEEARVLAAQLVETFPDSARIRLLAGQLAYGARDYPVALAHFQESHRLYPHWRSSHHIGRTLTQLGRFDDAEAALLALLPEHGICRRDLAWLYERMGDTARALESCEAFLADYPEDHLARSQLLRLRARESTPEELEQEVEGLTELGEAVSPDLIPELFEKLLVSGRSDRAREYVREQRDELDVRVKTRIAWIAYKAQAHDIAVELFTDVFASHVGDPKVMSALEAAAARIGCLDRVVELYEARAEHHPRLFGRIKRLRARLDEKG